MFKTKVCLRCCSRFMAPPRLDYTTSQPFKPSPSTKRALRTLTFGRADQAQQQSPRGPPRSPDTKPRNFKLKKEHSQGRDLSKPWDESVGQQQKESMKQFNERRTTRPLKEPPNLPAGLSMSNLKKELLYLQHPPKLAQHIRSLLIRNEDRKALALIQLSSKDIANTVSWNHLIDWQMKSGKTNAAISTFNEMKKRGQKPDSYTYTLLLRGLANYAHHPNSLGKALSLYHNLTSKKLGLSPSPTHVNAVIKVCARAKDMESMWDIASRMPERGSYAADSKTFTTILNYLRINSLTETVDGETTQQQLERIEEAVIKGKQLWAVIITRWRDGDLFVDEELVCAMGRLLLAGSRPKDWDNVLSLVQQTMGITRVEAPLGTVERAKSSTPQIRAPYTPDKMKEPSAEIDMTLSDVSEDQVFQLTQGKARSPSKSFVEAAGPQRNLFSFAKPGNNTLSLVIEACLKTILKLAAESYWELLTNPNTHAVQPDNNNVNMLLRVYRRTGDSTRAVALLQDLPRLNITPSGGTFRLAMNACEKNQNSGQALEHARLIIDTMQRTLSEPHIRSLTIYLNLSSGAQPAETTVAALQRLWPSIINLRALVRFSDAGQPVGLHMPNKDVMPGTTPASYTDEAMILFKTILRCFDKLLQPSDARFELGSLRGTFTERRDSLRALVLSIERDAKPGSARRLRTHVAADNDRRVKKHAGEEARG